jgi:hypothetical protein
MKAIVCRECGYSFENKEQGKYFCRNYEKEMKFFKFDAFCGSKPSELFEIT